MKNVTFISAGAGSGKTYRLAEEVVRAVSTGQAKPDGVILTTFTKKAASELRSRVSEHLIAHGQQTSARKMTGALIGTVHSVCGQLLKDYAFDPGLAVNLKILDEEASRGIFNRSITEGLSGEEQAAMYRIGEILDLKDWRDTFRKLGDLVRVNGIEPTSLPQWAEASVTSLLDGFKEDPHGRETLRVEVEQATNDLKNLIDSGRDTTKITERSLDALSTGLQELEKASDIKWESIQKLAKIKPSKKAEAFVDRVKILADLTYSWPEMRQDMRRVVSIWGIFKPTCSASSRILFLAASSLSFTNQPPPKGSRPEF